MYQRFGKRLIDIVVSAVALVVVSPLIFLVILVLAVVNRGKVFFFQTRPGLNEIPFQIYKFKTMNDACGESGELLSDEQRTTRVGRIIRNCSIDELLQLINVFKGEMSLVGPRPLLMEYLGRYSAAQRRRHEVLPGITGLAQVKGRNALSWRRRFRYDVFYVDRVSFGLDIQILLWTVRKVLLGQGIDVPEGKFLGNYCNSP